MPNEDSSSTLAEARTELQQALDLLDHPKKWQKAGTLIEKAIKRLASNKGNSKVTLAVTFLGGIGPLVSPDPKVGCRKTERDTIESSKQSIRWAIDALISEK